MQKAIRPSDVRVFAAQNYQTGPLRQQVHVNAPLTDYSVRYANDDMIAEQILPVMPVDKMSDVIFQYGSEHLRAMNLVRKPGARAQKLEWSVNASLSYLCKEHAVEVDIYDDVANDADQPLDLNMDSAQILADAMLLEEEIQVATMLTTASNYTNSGAPALKWSNAASDPILDIQNALTIAHRSFGQDPNTVAMSLPVWRAVRNNPNVVARCSVTGLGGSDVRQITTAMFAEACEVKNVVIGRATVVTSKPGSNAIGPAGDTRSYVWGNSAMLVHKGTPGVKSITFAQLFRRKGFKLADSWPELDRNTTVQRIRDVRDIQIIAPGAGYLFTNPI